MLTTMTVRRFALILALLAIGGCSSTSSSKAPLQSHDGLQLVPGTKFAEVYEKPGIDISHYSEFGVTPCQVAFKNNWLRRQNESRMDLSNRVTQKDVDRIKDSLSSSCDTIFREALLKDPAYNLVEEFSEGEQVLVLRPSIIDLDINAPDVRNSTATRNYTTSAGSQTLLMELVDGTTGEVLYRIVDRRRAMDNGTVQWSSSVTNKAESDRIMRRWASMLRSGLDEVRGM